MKCELCEEPGGEVLWRDARCRVVRVDEAGYPGFCRVIWSAHVREMTDLTESERVHFLRVVLAAETALRELVKPDKVNLASLGNVTPHLHWHVIPRFRDDPHFPNPIWGTQLRNASPVTASRPISGLGGALAELLGNSPPEAKEM